MLCYFIHIINHSQYLVASLQLQKGPISGLNRSSGLTPLSGSDLTGRPNAFGITKRANWSCEILTRRLSQIPAHRRFCRYAPVNTTALSFKVQKFNLCTGIVNNFKAARIDTLDNNVEIDDIFIFLLFNSKLLRRLNLTLALL